MKFSVKVIKRSNKTFLRLRWRDPVTGAWRERSSGTTRRREAEREAAALTAQIIDGSVDDDDLCWHDFRVRYEQEHMPSLAKKSRSAWGTAANWLELLRDEHAIAFDRLNDITASVMSRFQTALRDKGKPDTTIASYLRSIRAALGWAEQLGLISKRPGIRFPKRAKGIKKQMRSRPIVLEELERIIQACAKERPNDYPQWERFILGLYHSGFRVGEVRDLYWEECPEAKLSICNDFNIPVVKILAEGEKGHEDSYQPITQEFWNLCCETPPDERTGRVFPLITSRGKNYTVGRVMRHISDIGERANVVTDARKGKCATSHDIGKRAFTTKISDHLSQAELAEWMRHASPATTMSFYHAKTAQALAGKMWPQGDPAGDPTTNQQENAEH